MLVITLGFGAYQYVNTYLLVHYGGGVGRALQVEQNRAKLTSAVGRLSNVSGRDLLNGFWLTYSDQYGNEHVFFFDPGQLAQEDLTDQDIQALTDAIRSGQVSSRDGMRAVANADLPQPLQFHNLLYSFGTAGTTSLEAEAALQKKVDDKTANSNDLFDLSYVAELNGNYAQRDALNAQNCAQFGERCADSMMILLKGRVIDAKGDAVQGATVEIVSRPSTPAGVTDATGAYTITMGAKEMEKVRVRGSKRNFSDGYANVLVMTSGVKSYHVDDITLESPIQIVTIDYTKGTVTGGGNTYAKDGTVTIHTSQSTYQIPKGAIVGKDNRPYTASPVDVYLYEFTKGNPPTSLMQLDTFDQVVGYAGNLMKTFGMPYIQFFSQKDGTELDVLRSNPMVLTYKIADMDALRNNTDHIYRPLTDADMRLLVQASVGQPYQIDRQFLINNQLLAFPAFWVFDRRRGVWDNVGVSVLDIQGTIQSLFYTVRDTTQ